MLSYDPLRRSLLMMGRIHGRAFSIPGDYTTSPTKTSVSFKKMLPDIHPPAAYFKKSLRGLNNIKLDKAIKSPKHRSRKYARQLINELMVGLTSPLTEILKSYKSCFSSLNQCESVIAELTLRSLTKKGHRDLKDILQDVKALRAHTSIVGKHYVKRAAQVAGTVEGQELVAEAKGALGLIFEASADSLSRSQAMSSRGPHGDRWQTVISPHDLSKVGNARSGSVSMISGGLRDGSYSLDQGGGRSVEGDREADESVCDNETPPLPQSHFSTCLGELLTIQKALRRVPEIDLLVPTMVLVGAPNVGKSSIVRRVSSGAPEVADYAFTTRGLSIGHIVDTARDWRVQIMDTPGLLDRPAEKRNEMEKLTFASLAHLPTAVMFVIDPTGLSGDKSTLPAQLRIREALKQRFPRRPWIDVVSKADIDISDAVRAKLPIGHINVSVVSDQNISKLRELIDEKIVELLAAVREMQQQSPLEGEVQLPRS